MFKHKKEGSIPKDFKAFIERVKKPTFSKVLVNRGFRLTVTGLAGIAYWKMAHVFTLLYQGAPDAVFVGPLITVLQTSWSASIGMMAYDEGKGIELYSTLIPMLRELAPEAKERIANVKAYVYDNQGRVEQIQEDVAYLQALLAVGKVLKETRKANSGLFKVGKVLPTPARRALQEASKYKKEILKEYLQLSIFVSAFSFVLPHIVDPTTYPTYLSYSPPWGLLLLPFVVIPAGMAVSSISKNITLWALKRDIEKAWKQGEDGEMLKERAQKVLEELEGLKGIFEKIEELHSIPNPLS